MRPIRILFLLSWGLAAIALQGQEACLTQANGDCTGAIPIADSVYHQPDAVRGFGNKLEIKENPVDHLQWLEREHHSTWYKFRSPVTTTLTFDIIPDNPADDIDFLLFEGAIPGICDKIPSRVVQPVRSNISRNDPALGSRCGLSKDAADDFVRSGVGASYSRAIEVKEGDLFDLVVDYQDRPLAGYTIHFHYDPPPKPVDEEPTTQKQQLVINVTDARSGKPVDANLTIDGMVFDKVVEAKGRSTFHASSPLASSSRMNVEMHAASPRSAMRLSISILIGGGSVICMASKCFGTSSPPSILACASLTTAIASSTDTLNHSPLKCLPSILSNA